MAVDMKYVALLRGINVGGIRPVKMKSLRSLLESMEYTHVSTYLNSGNVIFESNKNQETVQEEINIRLKNELGFDIPTLVITHRALRNIEEAIPDEWAIDPHQRTDVAFLFPAIDSEKTIDDMPINREYIDIRYVKGALFWNIIRSDYNKSRLNNITGHPLYQQMTIRNVNTVRALAEK